jgi:hypothetical protein
MFRVSGLYVVDIYGSMIYFTDMLLYFTFRPLIVRIMFVIYRISVYVLDYGEMNHRLLGYLQYYSLLVNS